MTDKYWMRKTLRLAIKGWGKTSPNPIVGAIVVKDGKEVGSGWHQLAGDHHAEILALKEAGEHARGGTLFVTLEPCCTFGKTPPCVHAILKAGLKRVVIATLDPNPDHQGLGVEILKKHGVQIRVGVEEKRSQQLNEAFFCWVQHKRPFVLLKLAMTMDGRIATERGDSKWISCNISRARVQKLRQWADAILVGAETVRKDDPQLLVRSPKNWKHQPLRIVLSKSGNLGNSPQILRDKLANTRIESIESREDWKTFFEELARLNVTALLIEGGGEIAGMLLAHELIDKVEIFMAPKILGGRNSRPSFGGPDPIALVEAKSVTGLKIKRSGIDYQLTGYLSNVHGMH